MGEDPDVAGLLAHDLGHLVGVEPGHHPQEDGLGLLGRQLGHEPERRLGGEIDEDVGGGVFDAGPVREPGDRGGAVAGGPPAGVDEAVPGNGEEPAPEGALVAGEAVEPAGDFEPGVGGDVLRARRARRPAGSGATPAAVPATSQPGPGRRPAGRRRRRPRSRSSRWGRPGGTMSGFDAWQSRPCTAQLRLNVTVEQWGFVWGRLRAVGGDRRYESVKGVERRRGRRRPVDDHGEHDRDARRRW